MMIRDRTTKIKTQMNKFWIKSSFYSNSSVGGNTASFTSETQDDTIRLTLLVLSIKNHGIVNCSNTETEVDSNLNCELLEGLS